MKLEKLKKGMVKQLNNTENLKTLKNIVGNELFSVIIERLKGEHIYFSNFSGFATKEERDSEIRKDFYQGLSVPELAEKYKMKSWSIYKITEQT